MDNTTIGTASTPAAVAHDPPSLPASPLPKRTKVIDPTLTTGTLPRGSDSGTATPTPLAMAGPATHPTYPLPSQSASLASTLQVQFLSDKARAPTKGSTFAAGHDLYSARNIVIPARGRERVDTDIAISVPAGTCMFPESPSIA
jgi:dUTP pyrophosphatase